MKKILENNEETKAYLDSLPKCYAIFLWASYGILEVPWSKEVNSEGLPLVYNYYDGNGCCDEFHLMPINRISAGGFQGWYTNRESAEIIQNHLNEKFIDTNYSRITSMSIEALAEWINAFGYHDNSPWIKWFDQKYCSKCESEIIKKEECNSKLGFEPWYNSEVECSYCEVHDECRFFPGKENPSITEIVKMWLKEKD